MTELRGALPRRRAWGAKLVSTPCRVAVQGSEGFRFRVQRTPGRGSASTLYRILRRMQADGEGGPVTSAQEFRADSFVKILMQAGADVRTGVAPA